MIKTIYALIDPRDNTVRYVGCTSDFGKRFYTHVNGSDKTTQPWVEELQQERLAPLYRLLDEVDATRAVFREHYWIGVHRSGKLLNYFGNRPA